MLAGASTPGILKGDRIAVIIPTLAPTAISLLLIIVGAIFGANPLLGRGLKACIAPRQRLRTKNGICALEENALLFVPHRPHRKAPGTAIAIRRDTGGIEAQIPRAARLV